MIAAGPDGNLWFADGGSIPAIGLITTTGQITGFSAGLNAGSEPVGIAAGVDGNLWFTDDGGTPAIGRIGTAAPSNSFSFGKLKRNKRRGTATLTVEVPGPGTLALSGKGLVQHIGKRCRSEQGRRGGGQRREPGPAQGRFQGEEEAGTQPQRQGEGERECHLHADRRQPQHPVEADQADQAGLAG